MYDISATNTHNGINGRSAKIPMMALHTQPNGKVKISEANAWRMVSNTTTNREAAADHTPCTLDRLGFEQEKGQLREWMTVPVPLPVELLVEGYQHGER
jgi:hypothetical protein